MIGLELREQIDRDLDKLSVEQLGRVRDFLASLGLEKTGNGGEDSSTPNPSARPIRRAAPIRRGFQAKDVLELAGTWVGDDLAECLESVRQDRSLAEF
jgi:hypothetical protein